MISIKEAAQKAADFCQQIFPDAQDVLLEEVERDDLNKFWFITISYLTTAAKRTSTAIPAGAMEQIFPRFERRYKNLKVDATTGEVVSMKIRELQA